MAKKVTAAKDAKPPTASEVATLLGESYAQFKVLTSGPGAASEWRRYSKAGPWVLRVREGDRTLFYIAPQSGHCEVTVVLGERAVAAALAGRVEKKLHSSIRDAKSYVEGRPVRVLVRTNADVKAVQELVAVKLEPEGR
jgi:Protein of unknown function (DUF3788)